MKASKFRITVIIPFPLLPLKKEKLERKKKYFLKDLFRCLGSEPSLCFIQRKQKREIEIIKRQKKNTQGSFPPPHQTQRKGRQVPIYSISANCNMTKHRSAAGKMASKQIA